MSENYGVLKGQIIEFHRQWAGGVPVYQIHLFDGNSHYRVAFPQDSSTESLLYCLKNKYQHPLVKELAEQGAGFTPGSGSSSGSRLDYLRMNILEQENMLSLGDRDNLRDYNMKVEYSLKKALLSPGSWLSVFGNLEEFSGTDPVFGFFPSRVMRGIHMNQGFNDSGENSVMRDGGVFFHYPGEVRALLFASSRQSWHTEGLTGRPACSEGLECFGGMGMPRVIIAAALVGGWEKQKIALFNCSDRVVSVEGWVLEDWTGGREEISEKSISPGELSIMTLKGCARFSPSGGIITLLDADNVRIHGVSYMEHQVSKENWWVSF